ncbi:MAG: NifB/NifX family molybdenum-iron cluster-binding protein [Candidatus Omnitrophica bacterium]|nr:NifB/NifX family molybdenum-iron cluster-binding protein [Candidatus Omnitrophota bacterium]
MRVAISTEGDRVSPHFGRCPSFTLVEIKDNELVSQESIENPGHHPGFLPEFLGNKGVNCIIAGGMGQRARELFLAKNIKPILGVDLSIEKTIEGFLQNSLESDDSPCIPRSGKGYGLDKTECDHADE